MQTSNMLLQARQQPAGRQCHKTDFSHLSFQQVVLLNDTQTPHLSLALRRTTARRTRAQEEACGAAAGSAAAAPRPAASARSRGRAAAAATVGRDGVSCRVWTRPGVNTRGGGGEAGLVARKRQR